MTAGYLLTKIDPVESFLGQYINAQWQLVALLALTLLLCWLIPYWRSPNIKQPKGLNLFTDFDHIESPGYYKDKKTGRKFCKPCLTKNVLSELSTTPNGKLYCPSCDKPVEKLVAASASYDPPPIRRLTERFKNK